MRNIICDEYSKICQLTVYPNTSNQVCSKQQNTLNNISVKQNTTTIAQHSEILCRSVRKFYCKP